MGMCIGYHALASTATAIPFPPPARRDASLRPHSVLAGPAPIAHSEVLDTTCTRVSPVKPTTRLAAYALDFLRMPCSLLHSSHDQHTHSAGGHNKTCRAYLCHLLHMAGRGSQVGVRQLPQRPLQSAAFIHLRYKRVNADVVQCNQSIDISIPCAVLRPLTCHSAALKLSSSSHVS